MLNLSTLRLVALITCFASLALVPAVQAQTSDNMDAAPSAAEQPNEPAGDTTSSASEAMHKEKYGEMNVEQRIKTLHDKLKITAAQEDDWGKVAQTMRDNEATMAQLIQARHQNVATMTAVDDIKSYQQITQAHADGMQKMVSSFEPLYASLSDDQKKNADQIFGHFEGRHHGKKNKSNS